MTDRPKRLDGTGVISGGAHGIGCQLRRSNPDSATKYSPGDLAGAGDDMRRYWSLISTGVSLELSE